MNQNNNWQSGSAISKLGKPGQAALRFSELLSQDNWAVLGIGLNDLRPLVEFYGEDWRDRVLELVAERLLWCKEIHSNPNDLVVRLTTETFLAITQLSSVASWEEELRKGFMEDVLSTFPQAHLCDGMVCPSSSRRLPMPSLAIGVVTDQDGPFANPRDLLDRVTKARNQNERPALLFDLNSLGVTIGRLREEIQVAEYAPALLPLIERFAQVTTGPIHDLRNGLNILYEEARKVSELLPDTAQDEALVMAMRYCHFLLETYSELRFRGVGSPREVNLPELLQENTLLWTREIKTDIAVNIPSESVKVYVDRSQAAQALFNLLSWLVNQEESARISVTCRSSGNQGEIVVTGNFSLSMGEENLVKRALDELQNERQAMLYVFQKLLTRHGGCAQFQPGQIVLRFPGYQWQDVQSADALMEQIQNMQVEVEELAAHLNKILPNRDEWEQDFSLETVVGLGSRIIASLVDEFGQIRQQSAKQCQKTGEENQTTLWASLEAGSHFCQLLSANLLALEGQHIPSLQNTDVAGVLRSVQRMLRSKIEGIAEFEWNVEPDLPPVRANETLLAQVVLNLTLNALEELARVRPPVSRLSFAARQTPGAVQIDISDTGGGLPKEVMQQLFKEAISTRHHVEGGTGLQVVKSILDELGGGIEFCTTADRGTTASISLPIGEGSQ